MRYSQAVKSEVRQLYRAGNPRRLISESKGIPLSTIRLWTKDISARVLFITCEVCGKRERTLNIQRRYCSGRCRSRAYYHREREQSSSVVYTCHHCGKHYEPKHGNAKKFCTAECRQTAARKRAQRQRQIRRKRLLEFKTAMAILFQARLKDVRRSKIDPDTYKRELDIVEAYLTEYRYSYLIQKKK